MTALPGAVVLAAEPREDLRRVRHRIRQAMAGAGITPPEDIEGEFLPHVSLGYVNGSTDPARLSRLLLDLQPLDVCVRCDRVTQVLVTRTQGQYRWEVTDEVRLVSGSR